MTLTATKEGTHLLQKGQIGQAAKKLEEACQLEETNGNNPEKNHEILSLALAITTAHNLEKARQCNPKAFENYLRSMRKTKQNHE